MTKILIINHKAPYASSACRESIDVALMAASFDQGVSLVFMDDGVWQLKTDQHPDKILLKNTGVMFKAFKLYDLNRIYVDQASLDNRGLSVESLLIPVTTLDNQALSALIRQHDKVLSF